ncbi:MAG: succinate dehydrogenase cytochrome b subunit [Duncaniella sp.]|nr:succinate dehydrogenase cytochrome b subunit [Duncaniella sp.]
MWLTCSSIGRKLVMALTGLCLVLFVTFHCLMNGVALFWPSGYNAICEFLGANWYALVATVGLAALFIIHIIYACWLTLQNRKARGADRYVVVSKPAQVEWASQNMLILGIVILAFLVVHMIQFWAKMQLAEILHFEHVHEGVAVPPAAGSLFLHIAFSQVWTPIVYIIGFVALWFHLNHGMWSMMQSIGWNNDIWMKRLKCIGLWWTSIVVALFIAEAVVFTVRAHSNSWEKEVAEYVDWKSSADALDTDANVLPACQGKAACCGEAQDAPCCQGDAEVEALEIQEVVNE